MNSINLLQNQKSNLKGIPSNPNKYLKSLLNQLNNDFGEGNIDSLLKYEGLPIFIQKVLIGNMSSSTLLQNIVNKYGFEEVENDLKWLKKIELENQLQNAKDKKLEYAKQEFFSLVESQILSHESDILDLISEKNRINICLVKLDENTYLTQNNTQFSSDDKSEIKQKLQRILEIIENKLIMLNHTIDGFLYDLHMKRKFNGDYQYWTNKYEIQLEKFRKTLNIKRENNKYSGYPIDLLNLLQQIEKK